jgi:hypothetical protein
MFLFQVVLTPVLNFKTTTWPGNILAVIYQIQLKIAIEKTVFPVQP